MPKRPRLALILAFGLALLASPMVADQRLEPVGSFTWRMSDDPLFGGMSGLVLDAAGTGFIALSDRSALFRGTLERDGGVIIGVTSGPGEPLLDERGRPLPEDDADSEGLARAPDGRLYVSFEGDHRIGYFRPGEAIVRTVVRAPEFEDLQKNSGMEALALDPQGRPIAIPERSGVLTLPFPVYRLDGDSWSTPYRLRRDGAYLVVGADTGPDGRLYVLERHFAGLFGFSSRVRSFAFGPTGLTDEELLLQSPTGRHDNLEGISVWRDATGAIRVTMISDNNFNILQRTEFVEYRLVDSPSG